MKRVFGVLFILLLTCITFVGCGQTQVSNLVKTDKGIYDFYCDNVASVRQSFFDDLKNVEMESTDKAKVDYVKNNVLSQKQEELAAIASIECYEITATNKEVYLESEDGLIYVVLSGKNYICNLKSGQAEFSYTFTISKSDSKYSIKYKKIVSGTNKDCLIGVSYDKTLSHLTCDTESYLSDGSYIKIYTDFYALVNSQSVIRETIYQGATNNRSITTFETYKKIYSYKAKIAKSTQSNGAILTENLSEETFANSTSNDSCGYLIVVDKEKTGSANETKVNTFGEITSW